MKPNVNPSQPNELRVDAVLADVFGGADADFLSSAISREEGEFLKSIASLPGVRTTIEVGCANGISSLYICSGLARKEEPSHTAIDPFQTQDFNSRGRENVRAAGFDFFTLIEEPSEVALPALLQARHQYDLALIDGLHTADQTMVDFYYLDRMLRVGGFVVIDDVNSPAVNKIAHYVWTYPNYRLVAACGKRGPRRRIVNALKQFLAVTLFPVRKIFGDGFVREFVDASLLSPEAIWSLDFNSMVAFEKIGECDRDTNWFRGI